MRSVMRRVGTMTFSFLLQSPLPISPKPILSSKLYSVSSLPLPTQRFLTASHGSRLRVRTFSTKSTPNMPDSAAVSYLTQRQAAEIDETLMGPLGFTVDQLMVSIFSSCFFPYSALVFPPDHARFSHLLSGIGWS